ncbi:hypothetical protein V9K67_13535 [Paraflavisolibacter sp. H34]|uniref:hypothetical protein n=1 Tax=Huijunlia imazamoxiresistens TaxID=3127457 RepID=UPI003017B7E8
MHNPFVPFSERLLYALAESGKEYFVRQTLSLESDCGLEGSFLFTHYSSQAEAQAHFGALDQDIYRKLYDWKNPEDREKLLIAARRPAGYRIYAALFHPQWQKSISQEFVRKLRTYIQSKLGWNPGKGETVHPAIYLEFGQLYTRLRYKTQEVSVKFEEIENHF